MRVFSAKCLGNNILPFFRHNFNRFTSNIRSRYVTRVCILFYTRVSTSPNSVTFFMISSTVLYDFISNDLFPECKYKSDRRRRRKEIQANELPALN